MLSDLARSFMQMGLEQIRQQLVNGDAVINNPLKVGVLSQLGMDISGGKIPEFFNGIFGDAESLPALDTALAFGISEEQFQAIPAQNERLESEAPSYSSAQLLDIYNNSPAARDFGVRATYDPATGMFTEDLSSFGFTGDSATNTFTPEEFFARVGLEGANFNNSPNTPLSLIHI